MGRISFGRVPRKSGPQFYIDCDECDPGGADQHAGILYDGPDAKETRRIVRLHLRDNPSHTVVVWWWDDEIIKMEV